MSGGKLMGRAIRSSKSDWNIELAAGHHEHVGRIVHYLIERDQRKAERHKLDDGPQSDHGRSNSQSRESIFANGRVDNSLRTEALQQTLADFVGSLIFGDFFAHKNNVRIAFEFFSQRFVEGLAIGDFSHFFAPSK